MGYVKPADRTSVWYLFNKLFKVRINPRHAQSVEDIQRYGTPSTGNEDVDREMDKAEHVVMWSIARMEAFFNEGYPVKLVRREDCDEIYKLVNNHLQLMNNRVVQSENFTEDEQTLKELIRLDVFANAVFEHARWGLRDNLQHAGYARRARANDPFAKLGDLNRSRVSNAHKPVAASTPPGSMGRRYGLAANREVDPVPTAPDQPLQADPMPEDPSLPKRISLGEMFNERLQMGSRWR